jgi:hypothetical protein
MKALFTTADTERTESAQRLEFLLYASSVRSVSAVVNSAFHTFNCNPL